MTGLSRRFRWKAVRILYVLSLLSAGDMAGLFDFLNTTYDDRTTDKGGR